MELQIADIATLIGEPVRAKILWTLLDGRAYTATELALFADASPQNASIHLSKLVQADFLEVARQGRHRYYRFSNQDVAYAIEALANLIPANKTEIKSGDEKSGIKYCRTCYDHLAGKVGVLINEALICREIIAPSGNNYEVSGVGVKWFLNLGINVDTLKEERRFFARPCLDWSERRYHIAGALGAAILERMLLLHWVRKIKSSRAIIITSEGKKGMYESLRIEV